MEQQQQQQPVRLSQSAEFAIRALVETHGLDRAPVCDEASGERREKARNRVLVAQIIRTVGSRECHFLVAKTLAWLAYCSEPVEAARRYALVVRYSGPDVVSDTGYGDLSRALLRMLFLASRRELRPPAPGCFFVFGGFRMNATPRKDQTQPSIDVLVVSLIDGIASGIHRAVVRAEFPDAPAQSPAERFLQKLQIKLLVQITGPGFFGGYVNVSIDCSACGNADRAERKRRCIGCNATRYCGVDCQRRHWPEHRARCEAERRKMAEGGDRAKRLARLNRFYVRRMVQTMKAERADEMAALALAGLRPGVPVSQVMHGHALLVSYEGEEDSVRPRFAGRMIALMIQASERTGMPLESVHGFKLACVPFENTATEVRRRIPGRFLVMLTAAIEGRTEYADYHVLDAGPIRPETDALLSQIHDQ